MLVLSRHEKETIHIGDDISVTICRIGPTSVRVGITAPRDMHIMRGELKEPSEAQRSDSDSVLA